MLPVSRPQFFVITSQSCCPTIGLKSDTKILVSFLVHLKEYELVANTVHLGVKLENKTYEPHTYNILKHRVLNLNKIIKYIEYPSQEPFFLLPPLATGDQTQGSYAC